MATAAYISAGKECIDKLRSNPSQDLELSHAALYDDGCEVLFKWLMKGDDNSLNGEFPYRFSIVTLNDTRMGDRGFSALTDWLESICQAEPRISIVTFINLRSNNIRGTWSIAERFIAAISTSLTTLHLSNNTFSSDFRASLLSSLHQLSGLRVLGISMCSLTHTDANLLSRYLASPKCTLVGFSANANHFGYNGVRCIVDSLRRNYRIQNAEMFSNELVEGEEVHEREEDVAVDADTVGLREWVGASGTLASYARGSGCSASMAKLTTVLKTIIGRNVVLRHAIACDAFLLLKWGRVLLMRGSKAQGLLGDDLKPLSLSFAILPTELKLHILSFLAPMLSAAQCARVLHYAADPRQLPALRLSLPVRRSLRSSRPGANSSIGETPGAVGKGRRRGSLARFPSVPETPPTAEIPIIGMCRLPHLGVGCTCHNTRQALWLESMCCDAYDVEL